MVINDKSLLSYIPALVLYTVYMECSISAISCDLMNRLYNSAEIDGYRQEQWSLPFE